MNKTPTTLIIMDGFGLSDHVGGNAVKAAKTPRLDQFFQEYAHTELSASGLDVGLPEGQMGNSEVGHTNIGAGRVVFQDLPRITKAIADGDFFTNPAYQHAMDACKEKGTALHLMGLLSDGGVHSHIQHLFALLKLARDKGLERVYIHAFLDGRDVSPTSGVEFVAQTVEQCREIGVGKIATVMGRYYAMDRDKRWDRVEQAYDAMVYGESAHFNPVPVAAVKDSYAAGITDEFVEPVVCDTEGTISDNDSVIFFNFRPDRAREITRTLVDPDFDGFTRQYFPVTFVCNTEYDATMPHVEDVYKRQELRRLPHCLAGEIHICLGFHHKALGPGERYDVIGGLEFDLVELHAQPLRQQVHCQKAHIVSGAGIFLARIPQPHNQPVHRLLFKQHVSLLTQNQLEAAPTSREPQIGGGKVSFPA